MLFEVGQAVKDAGASILRGGAYKTADVTLLIPGQGKEGLELLQEAGRELQMPTITRSSTRATSTSSLSTRTCSRSRRNMQNFNLLLEVGRTNKPVFIKRGLAASITDLLMSAEYVLSQGNHRVILCERGIRTFAEEVRFTLDVSAVPVLQERCHLPVFVDPSHAAGKRDLVPALRSRASPPAPPGASSRCIAAPIAPCATDPRPCCRRTSCA